MLACSRTDPAPAAFLLRLFPACHCDEHTLPGFWRRSQARTAPDTLIDHRALHWTDLKSVTNSPTSRHVTIRSIWGYIFMVPEMKTQGAINRWIQKHPWDRVRCHHLAALHCTNCWERNHGDCDRAPTRSSSTGSAPLWGQLSLHQRSSKV